MHWLLPLAFFLAPSAPPPVWCADATASAWAMSHLESVMNAEGAEGAFVRKTYSLPRVPRDSLVRVVDERVCARASAVYYRDHLGPPPPGGVTVVRIRDRYAVYGGISAGEWTVMTIYSSDFEPIVSLLM
jgi:hypothetical protein